MKKIFTRLTGLLLVSSFSLMATEVTIQPEFSSTGSSMVFFGYIDGDLSTNFDKKLQHREISWKDKQNKILSTKAYYIPTSLDQDLAFCVESKCSSYTNLSLQGGDHIMSLENARSNEAELSIIIENPSELDTGIEPISTAIFTITVGEIDFLYQEQLDQNGSILSSSFSRGVSMSTMKGVPLSQNVNTLEACSLGTFTNAEPVTLLGCTQKYQMKTQSTFPESDSFVESTLKDTNYGYADILKLKNDNWVIRDTYLKFPLNNFSLDANQKVSLELTLNKFDTLSIAPKIEPLDLFVVYDGAWKEEGITYNNIPSSSNKPVSQGLLDIRIGNGAIASWDVTHIIRDSINLGNEYISFKLGARYNGAYGRSMIFYSKESTTGNAPRLIVETVEIGDEVVTWAVVE